MHKVIRIALVISVLAVLMTVLGSVLIVDSQNEWRQLGPEISGSTAVLNGLLVSLAPLCVIWLGVFVIYVVRKGARVLEH
jgi:uncharacterized BrkB/YihY/UPF0761 family membrane protein